MSEDKLAQILEDVGNGEMDVDEAFDEIACVIDFEEPYEGE